MLTLNIDIDPTESFKGIKEDKLLAATGLLPSFAQMVKMQQPETTRQAFDMLMEVYGFGFGDGTGWGTVDPDGYYVSDQEEDEKLAPLLTIELAKDIMMYVYQYAIVAVVGKDETLISRFD